MQYVSFTESQDNAPPVRVVQCCQTGPTINYESYTARPSTPTLAEAHYWQIDPSRLAPRCLVSELTTSRVYSLSTTISRVALYRHLDGNPPTSKYTVSKKRHQQLGHAFSNATFGNKLVSVGFKTYPSLHPLMSFVLL